MSERELRKRTWDDSMDITLGTVNDSLDKIMMIWEIQQVRPDDAMVSLVDRLAILAAKDAQSIPNEDIKAMNNEVKTLLCNTYMRMARRFMENETEKTMFCMKMHYFAQYASYRYAVVKHKHPGFNKLYYTPINQLLHYLENVQVEGKSEKDVIDAFWKDILIDTRNDPNQVVLGYDIWRCYKKLEEIDTTFYQREGIHLQHLQDNELLYDLYRCPPFTDND